MQHVISSNGITLFDTDGTIRVLPKDTFEYDYFIKNDGKYVSNNQGINNSTANSYIKVDTTRAIENITVKINAEISSQASYDFGYIIINESQTAPAYNTTTGRLTCISGAGTNDYERELEIGKVYYIHFGYYKNGSSYAGKDSFTINSIEFEGADREMIYTSNENGRIEAFLEAEKEIQNIKADTRASDPVYISSATTTLSTAKQVDSG